MAGLRERQKAQRERKITTAAERMFRERGFTQTKIEDIAVEADVSVGTIYNYFESKTDLLLVLVSVNDEHIRLEYEKILASDMSDPVQCICNIFSATTLQSLKGLGRENWRHLLATSIVQMDSPLGKNYLSLTERLLQRVMTILQNLQARGHIAADCDTDRIADVLFRVESTLYVDLVSSDETTFEGYQSQLEAHTRFVLGNLA